MLWQVLRSKRLIRSSTVPWHHDGGLAWVGLLFFEGGYIQPFRITLCDINCFIDIVQPYVYVYIYIYIYSIYIYIYWFILFLERERDMYPVFSPNWVWINRHQLFFLGCGIWFFQNSWEDHAMTNHIAIHDIKLWYPTGRSWMSLVGIRGDPNWAGTPSNCDVLGYTLATSMWVFETGA